MPDSHHRTLVIMLLTSPCRRHNTLAFVSVGLGTLFVLVQIVLDTVIVRRGPEIFPAFVAVETPTPAATNGTLATVVALLVPV